MTQVPRVPVRSAAARYGYFAVAWLCVGLGVVGALLPIVPTTPFLLLALAAFAQSSERFHGWLLNHRVLGPRLRAWRRERVIPWSAKLTAYLSMTASMSMLAFVLKVKWLPLAIAAAICLAGVVALSRFPSAPRDDGHRLQSPDDAVE